MVFRIFYEDEMTADIRRSIKNLGTRQLFYLEEVIRREKKKRQQAVFDQWLEYVNQLKPGIKSPQRRFD